jgi:hypothetical protein
MHLPEKLHAFASHMANIAAVHQDTRQESLFVGCSRKTTTAAVTLTSLILSI